MADRPKILLADDDHDLVHVLSGVLEEHGYEVVAVHTAKDVVATVDRERPDLVLQDVMMPDATEGFHVVWELRRRTDTYFRDVPIIVLTAIHQKTELRFYPDSGDGTYSAGEYLPVQGFVDKPVDTQDLLKEIGRVLGAKPPA